MCDVGASMTVHRVVMCVHVRQYVMDDKTR